MRGSKQRNRNDANSLGLFVNLFKLFEASPLLLSLPVITPPQTSSLTLGIM